MRVISFTASAGDKPLVGDHITVTYRDTEIIGVVVKINPKTGKGDVEIDVPPLAKAEKCYKKNPHLT